VTRRGPAKQTARQRGMRSTVCVVAALMAIEEQSEWWGVQRGGEGIGFDLQRQIRRGGGWHKW
jgi:hypothetical protein